MADLLIYFQPDRWKRRLLDILRAELVRREAAQADGWDASEEEYLFEETLLALYPVDGLDRYAPIDDRELKEDDF